MQGWIKVYRKSLDSSVWEAGPIVWMVWTWCLMKASHDGNVFPFNGEDLRIEPGQFVTGREKALRELPISAQQWRTAMDYLKSTSRITSKATNKFSLVQVLNWDSYQKDNQQGNQPLTNEQPTTNQPLTTIKNVKNEKNDELDSEVALRARTPQEDAEQFFSSGDQQGEMLQYLASKGLSGDVAKRELDSFCRYWTEPTRNGKRVRWQLEKTFEIRRRLITWFSRSKSNTSINSPKGMVL